MLFFPCLSQELINTLLSVDQSKRITASEALKHPWIVVCKNTSTGLFLLKFLTDQMAFLLNKFINPEERVSLGYDRKP